ncbi:MAG: HD-GYP domain-containing protein (c-di-GMP phosphodiesterase class II) [Paraglaciecola psychrophila]
MIKKNVNSGRTIKEQVKTPIRVTGLKIGMYVTELDRPWLETPFILQGFKIEQYEDIETLSEYCDFVYIEGTIDTWLNDKQRESGNNTRAAGKNYTNSTSNKQEYQKATEVHQKARQLTRTFMDNVRLGQAIDVVEVKRTVSECVSSIIRNPDALVWISKIREKDHYTSEHSLNVGLLAITFGRHMGLLEDDLNKLGFAAMLHDVGKMRIPEGILNKPGPLTDQEFELMKRHPQFGRDILLSHKNIFHGATDVAFGHHEALDGSGYPRKLKASGISEVTRMVTLCDVYDAITSDRAYKKGRSSLDALKILYDNKGTKYDERLVTEFISCMGLYPPGSVVELVSGQVGIVISTNYRNRHLPKVLVLRDENKTPQPEKVINLEQSAKTEQHGHFIKVVLPNGSNGIRLEQYIEKGLTIA